MYPLDFFTLGYVSGLLADGLPTPFAIPGLVYLVVLLVGFLFAGYLAARSGFGLPPKFTPTLLFILAGSMGSILIPAAHRWALPSHHLLQHLPRGRANVVGHLTQPIETSGAHARKRPRLQVEVEKLFIRGVEIPARGTIRITAAAPLLSPLSLGDRLLIRQVTLRPPRRHLNPGDFDYREFLRLRNIHAIAYASPKSIERLAPQEKLAWKRWIFGFREEMRGHIQRAFPPETSGLLEAITLGIREDLDWNLRESFRLAGVSHILAISGLHVGFISAFFFFVLLALFRRLPPNAFPVAPVVMTPMKLASLIVIPIVILFTVLTGARVSTVRASIMAVVYLATRLLERPGGALHSIFLAALIILVLQPGFIWDTGFQLSFIAVVAIILAVRRLPRPEPKQTLKDWGWWQNRLIQFAGIQGVVSITMAPLTASHFQEIHLAGLITNFFLIPIASITVPLTFFVSCFSALSNIVLSSSLEWIWLPADLLLGFFAQWMIHIAHLAASIPAGTINVPPPSPFLIAFFLISLCMALGVRTAAIRKSGWISVALAMALLFTPLLPSQPLASGQTSLMIPDAGRDDVFFIRLPDGRGFVIDAARQSSSKFNTWRNVLAPLLRTLDERNWDSLFLLGNKGPGNTAEQVLNIGMNLKRVIKFERDGTLHSRAIHEESSEIFHSSEFPRSQLLWGTSSGKAKLFLRKLGHGHLALSLRQGEAQWLFLIKRGRKPIQNFHLPLGKFDLVRLPEPMLREESVLQWLEKIRPAAVIAAPMRTKRLPIEQWRRIRTRQRSLGVYRPGRGGMLRVRTDGKSLKSGASAERYLAASPWPGTSHGRWARYLSPSEDLRLGSTQRSKPKFRDNPAESR